MRKYRKIILYFFFIFVIFVIYTISKKGALTENKMANEDVLEEVSEQQIEEYLREELSELTEYEQYIKQKSNEQAFMIIENMGVFDEIIKKESEFYLIYVGEMWNDHKVNWDYFLVSDDLEDIFFFDMTNNVILTLEEWRKSEYYRKL